MSAVESAFALQLAACGYDASRQYRAIKGRRYAWDFYIASLNVLIEIQGGTWVKSGHTSGVGIQRDCTKANMATLHGFRTLTFTTQDVESGRAIDTVIELDKRLREVTNE